MIEFRLTSGMEQLITADLARIHPFAHERVGFVICQTADRGGDGVVILAADYLPVDDGDYVETERFGALINRSALRKALECAYFQKAAIFHVHMHDHLGGPAFSRPDLDEARKFVPDFWKASPNQPHGLLLLSRDSAVSLAWIQASRPPVAVNRVTVVGWPLRRFDGGHRV